MKAFCLTFFTVEFGYDKANPPDAFADAYALAYASADSISGFPLSHSAPWLTSIGEGYNNSKYGFFSYFWA